MTVNFMGRTFTHSGHQENTADDPRLVGEPGNDSQASPGAKPLRLGGWKSQIRANGVCRHMTSRKVARDLRTGIRVVVCREMSATAAAVASTSERMSARTVGLQSARSSAVFDFSIAAAKGSTIESNSLLVTVSGSSLP